MTIKIKQWRTQSGFKDCPSRTRTRSKSSQLTAWGQPELYYYICSIVIFFFWKKVQHTSKYNWPRIDIFLQVEDDEYSHRPSYDGHDLSRGRHSITGMMPWLVLRTQTRFQWLDHTHRMHTAYDSFLSLLKIPCKSSSLWSGQSIKLEPTITCDSDTNVSHRGFARLHQENIHFT